MADPADLGILLARTGGDPLLPEGLPWQAALLGQKPELEDKPQALDFLQTDDSLDSLVQGWGLLHPPGSDALLDAVAPLVAWRQDGIAEAWAALRKPGTPPTVRTWEIAPGTTGLQFLRRDFGALPRHLRPQYLLILGDFDGISLEFQRRLARELFVGRLCGESPAAYAAYAEKVMSAEQANGAERGRLLLYSASDPRRRDSAVDTGLSAALKPVAVRAADASRVIGGVGHDVHMMGPKGDPGLQSWPQAHQGLAAGPPTVLFSITHGVGDPRWNHEEKRAQQGRTVLPGGQLLDPAQVSSQPFLPGGIWFNLACFGGGTPELSAFAPWLRRLVGAGGASASGVPDVLATQASEGAFVARQPQLALANPDGPVAVIAHADIAFTFSFQAEGDGGRFKADVTAIENLLDGLLEGRRAGVAFAKLDAALTRIDTSLLARVQDQHEAADAALRALFDARKAHGDGPAEGAVGEVYACLDGLILEHGREGLTLETIAEALGWTLVRLASVIGAAQAQDRRRSLVAGAIDWLAHHDLSGWILLGDPAARLVLGPTQATATPHAPSAEALVSAQLGLGGPPPTPPATRPRPEAPARSLPVPIEVIELAVAEYMVDVLERGERTGKSVAEAHGIDFAALRGWHEAYTAGGRRALTQG